MKVIAGTLTWKFKIFPSKLNVPVATVGSLLDGTSFVPAGAE